MKNTKKLTQPSGLPRTACSAVEESTTWFTARWEGSRGKAMRCPSRKTHANAKIDLQRWRAEGKTGKLYIEIETKIRRVEIFADDLPNADGVAVGRERQSAEAKHSTPT